MPGQKSIRTLFNLTGLILVGFFIFISLRVFHPELMIGQFKSLLQRPNVLIAITLLYGTAFILRAAAWKLYLKNRASFRKCLAGLLYSLFVNHLSPVKAGDAVRAAVFKGDRSVSLGQAAHSVVVLRLLDMLVLIVFAGAGFAVLLGSFGLNVPLVILLACLAGAGFLLLWMKFPEFLRKQTLQLKEGLHGVRGMAILCLIIVSWVLEAFVIFGVAAPGSLSFLESIWVNSVTVAGQVFQVTPGGVGTYESVMTAALVQTGEAVQEAYGYAVISHVFKFVFSYAGGLAAFLLLPLPVRELTTFMKRKERDRIGKS
ncbi:lysylphosphatidylglycerol synthase transmembrane domain-containing protein [Metabacillus indicus]|uniref:lysylphosphatidylglycerol synthase transmembrane domain-containing protein n=1 Tax=Metabacillus indicus TaxID=246786 RepID=UPI003174E9FC